MDVNLIRLSRQYDCVSEQAKEFREAYQSCENDFMEREVKYIDKINDLCKWKTKAKNQLKILYNMQKNHVSSVDYKKLLNEYKMLSERHASL